MKNIRKGNDIKIAWSIYMKDGTAFNLDGLNVSLYLTSMFSRKKLDGFVVNGNIIQWTFYGKDQKSSGKYSLELVVNDGNKGMITTDSCDFVDLVSCSCQLNGGKDEDGVETQTIELESEVDVASGDVVTIVVDEVLSETSVNPVQNKVITAELNKKIDGETLEKRISREHIYFYYVVIENKVYYKGYNVNEMTELQPWLLNFVVGLPITPHLLILDNDQNVNISSNKFEITTNPLGLQWQYDDLQYTLVFNNGQVITTTAIPSGGNGGDLSAYLTKIEAEETYQPKGDYVEVERWTSTNMTMMDSINLNATEIAKQQENLTELSAEVGKKVDADNVATINGQSLVGGGNITIVGGEKGEKGDKGDKGDQGNSGYTGAADELEVVNNLTQGGATAALSAEMGKVLSENTEARFAELTDKIDSPMVTWEKTIEDADIEWLDNTRLVWNNATESVAGYKTSAKIILLDSKTKYVLFPYISKKTYGYYAAVFFDTGFNVVESMQVPKNFSSDFRNVVVEIPDNIKAMRVSKTDGENFSFTEYQTMNELANALADLTSLEEVQAETKVGSVLYANKQYTQNEGILESVTNARYKRIKVLEGETYTIVGSADANMAVWRWNDKYSKTILSNVDLVASEEYGTKKAFVEITAPKNAVWLYVGWVVSGNKAIDEGHIYRKKTGAMDALRNIRTSEYPQFDFSSYYQDGKSDNFYDYVTPLENDAYIVVGQSNVDGRINNAQFPATITFGGKTIETSKSLTNLQFMKSSVNSVYDELTKKFQPRNNTGAWAFDEIIYNLLDKLVYNPSSNNRDFYVLKATKGATTIEPRYDEAFSADIKVLKDKGWNSMMIHLKNLIKSAKLQNPNLRFKGIIIYECEGDMTVTKYPYQYYNNLGGMIAYIRGLVGQPNIPVFIGAPATNLPGYNQLVVDDMRELAKNMNDIHLIEIGESEGWVDDGMNVHFNAAAATRIGGLYYQAMVDAKII